MRNPFTRIPKATVLAVAAIVALAGCSTAAPDPGSSGGTPGSETPAKPESLTINVFSGMFQENMQRYVVEPFEKEYGITVNLVTTAPPLATLQAQGDNPEIDLFIAGDPQRMLAQNAGLLQEYDPAVVTNAADLYDVARKENMAAVMNFTSQGLAYNTSKVTTEPTSWFDLFDMKFPRGVVVRAPDAQNTISWLTLMAKELNGDWPTQISDYDEVLNRVKTQLKPNLYAAVSSSGDVDVAMNQSDVALGVWQDAQVRASQVKGTPLKFAAPKEGALPIATMVALTKTPNKYWAEVLMNYILDADVQASWAENGGYGPSNAKAKVSDELAEHITYGPDKIAVLVQLPWDKIVPLSTELIEKFNAAIAN